MSQTHEADTILSCSPRAAGRRSGRGLLSVVIPCHNERDVIESTHARLGEVLPDTGMDFEIIYIDDGSRDDTLERLAQRYYGDKTRWEEIRDANKKTLKGGIERMLTYYVPEVRVVEHVAYTELDRVNESAFRDLEVKLQTPDEVVDVMRA
jgi:glycosyltransferase involved in cell wall biosynthesis